MKVYPNYFQVNGYNIVKEENGYHVYTRNWKPLLVCNCRRDAIQFCLALLVPEEDEDF